MKCNKKEIAKALLKLIGKLGLIGLLFFVVTFVIYIHRTDAGGFGTIHRILHD